MKTVKIILVFYVCSVIMFLKALLYAFRYALPFQTYENRDMSLLTRKLKKKSAKQKIIESHDADYCNTSEEISRNLKHHYLDALRVEIPHSMVESLALPLNSCFTNPIMEEIEPNRQQIKSLGSKRYLLESSFESETKTIIRKLVLEIISGKLFYGEFRLESPCKILLYCDLSEFCDWFKKDSLESLLINLCNQFNPNGERNLTEKALISSSSENCCVLTGFSKLPDDIKRNVSSFWSMPSEQSQSSVFRYSTILLEVSSSDNGIFASFDRYLKLRGVNARNLAISILKGYEKDPTVFFDELKRMNLLFLLEMPTACVLRACSVYLKKGIRNKYSFIDSVLTASAVDYCKYRNINYSVEGVSAIHRIGEILFNQNAYIDSAIFIETEFEMFDLNLARVLGWFTVLGSKEYRIAHLSIGHCLIVKYLNASLSRSNLEDPLANGNVPTFYVVIDMNQGVSSLKYAYASTKHRNIILGVSSKKSGYDVHYYLREDFQSTFDLMPSDHFSITIRNSPICEKTSFRVSSNIFPIPFVGDHILLSLTERMRLNGFLFALNYAATRPKLPANQVVTRLNYTYAIRTENDVIFYDFSLNNENIFALASYVSAMNKMLSSWPDFVNFSVWEKRLHLDLNNLRFAAKVVAIAFGVKSWPERTSSVFDELLEHFKTDYTTDKWVLSLGPRVFQNRYCEDYEKLGAILKNEQSNIPPIDSANMLTVILQY